MLLITACNDLFLSFQQVSHTSPEQSAHSSLGNLSSSSRFDGLLAWSLVFSSTYRFSMGFKSLWPKSSSSSFIVSDRGMHLVRQSGCRFSIQIVLRILQSSLQVFSCAEVEFFLALQLRNPFLCRVLLIVFFYTTITDLPERFTHVLPVVLGS